MFSSFVVLFVNIKAILVNISITNQNGKLLQLKFIFVTKSFEFNETFYHTLWNLLELSTNFNLLSLLFLPNRFRAHSSEECSAEQFNNLVGLGDHQDLIANPPSQHSISVKLKCWPFPTS